MPRPRSAGLASLSACLLSAAAFALILTPATTSPPTTTASSAAANTRKFLATQLSRAASKGPENATFSAQLDPARGYMCVAMCNKQLDSFFDVCTCKGCDKNNQCVYSAPECAQRCRCNCSQLSDSDVRLDTTGQPAASRTARP